MIKFLAIFFILLLVGIWLDLFAPPPPPAPVTQLICYPNESPLWKSSGWEPITAADKNRVSELVGAEKAEMQYQEDAVLCTFWSDNAPEMDVRGGFYYWRLK